MSDTAIEVLRCSEIPNKSDTISRQAAIDAADRADYTGLAVEDVKKVTDEVVKELKQLPSVQPEIIRCKDCKYAHITYSGEVKYCDIWFPDESHYMDTDNFCSFAERREE